MKITSQIEEFKDAASSKLPCLYSHFPLKFLDVENAQKGRKKHCVLGRQFNGLFSEPDGNFIEISINLSNNYFEVDRDNYGSIPLYYSSKHLLLSTDPRLLFEDETNALDMTAIGEYLSAAYISGGNTIYQNIKILMPDEIIVIKPHSFEIKKKLIFPAISINSENEVENLLERAIDNSIMNLIDYIPGSAYLNLSGGADSSLILSKIHEISGSAENIMTSTYFHADWRKDIDDWRYAEFVSKKYNTTHSRVDIYNEDFRTSNLELSLKSKYLFHTYSTAFYIQNKTFNNLHLDIPIINGSGPDESMIGTEKLTISDLVSKKNMPKKDWINYMLSNFDYLKLNQEAVNNLLLQDCGSISESRKIILECLLDSPDFLEFQRRYHTLTVLQDHIRELSFVSLCSNRQILFPYLTNDIFKLVFSTNFESLNRNLMYKSAVKNILMKYLPYDFVFRKKIGFQSPSHPYFASDFGCGKEIRRLLSKPSNIINIDYAKVNILNKLQNSSDLFKRYDFMEWTVFNLLILEENICKT